MYIFIFKLDVWFSFFFLRRCSNVDWFSFYEFARSIGYIFVLTMNVSFFYEKCILNQRDERVEFKVDCFFSHFKFLLQVFVLSYIWMYFRIILSFLIFFLFFFKVYVTWSFKNLDILRAYFVHGKKVFF